jgi:diguanylate cyclase (GGDEF)-like protein
MPEFSQRTLGYARNALFEMQPEDLYTTHELWGFWKQTLFDAGFPMEFIDIVQTYGSNWTDIIPDLYTGKFGPRNRSTSAHNIPPGIGERFLRKLVHFALSETGETLIGQQLRQSLEADGFPVNSTEQTDTPVELAKLPNKESLLRDLAKQFRDGNLTSVVFIDLDNFKLVNDEHGHAEGDNCLVEVVANMATVVVGKGKLYRVGGDEFCLLLPNFSRFEAAATAERVRSTVDALAPFGGTTKVTTSIGVAASDGLGLANPQSLVNAADEAMYISKWTTKNRVTTWPPSTGDSDFAHENRAKAKKDTTR